MTSYFPVSVPYLDHKTVLKKFPSLVINKEINCTLSVRTFEIPFHHGSVTVINYYYGSGSAKQKVTVPEVPVTVSQH